LTTHQKRGHLPELFSDRCNVVIFNSSEDEMESFDEWQNRIYVDQSDGIRRIAEDLSNDNRFHLVLRVHPNLMNVQNSQTNNMLELEKLFPNMTVVSAESTVSTYDLVDACDVVISFGSTVGMEAALAKKPVFLLALAIYEDLGSCIKPKSHEEFLVLVRRFAEGGRDFVPTQYEMERGVEIYGYFHKMWGEEYRYVKPISVAKSLMVKHGEEIFLNYSITNRILALFSRLLVNIKKACQKLL
jgi:hypothetical protein